MHGCIFHPIIYYTATAISNVPPTVTCEDTEPPSVSRSKSIDYHSEYQVCNMIYYLNGTIESQGISVAIAGRNIQVTVQMGGT